MTDSNDSMSWRFVRFGLLVTGKGEERFLPSFLRALTTPGNCTFKVLRRVPQFSPIKSTKRKLKMVGSGKTIPNRDVEAIGLPARRFLQQQDTFAVLVDDLEWDRRNDHREIFDRYRSALDTILPRSMRQRASVHFLIQMLEAYYFAHADAVNSALGTNLTDFDRDVESIRHPKNRLKKLKHGFDETADGEAIVNGLDLAHVLDNPTTCASLRSLVAWCAAAKGDTFSTEFRLIDGVYSIVTGPQIASLAQSPT